MGLYIDMEMPPDGRYTVCVTHDSDGVVHWVFQNQDTLEFLKHGAVTEVPEPHGRLIDADVLCNRLEIASRTSYEMREAIEYVAKWIVKYVPTVIPARKEGET